MHAMLRISLVVALGIFISMTPIVLAASAPVRQPPSATPVPPHDTPTTPHMRESHGPLVTVKVRALVPDKVKVSDPAQGTVRATVLAIDRAINQVTVQTHEGQRLSLYLTPASLAGMQVGQQYILQVAQRSEQASSLDEGLYDGNRW